MDTTVPQSHPIDSFQNDPAGTIVWRVHLRSSVKQAYDYIAEPHLRERYWAERSWQEDGYLFFEIINYPVFSGKILQAREPSIFEFEYYGCIATFTFSDDGHGGTDVLMESRGVAEQLRTEMIAGWVSLLMAYKAACDFGVDLRNHDHLRSWVTGYVDN